MKKKIRDAKVNASYYLSETKQYIRDHIDKHRIARLPAEDEVSTKPVPVTEERMLKHSNFCIGLGYNVPVPSLNQVVNGIATFDNGGDFPKRLRDGRFECANFSGMDFSGGVFHSVDFRDGTMLNGANLSNMTISNTTFHGVDAIGADFSGSYFSDCAFLSGKFSHADFTGVRIKIPVMGQSLFRADLTGAIFVGCDTSGEDVIRFIRQCDSDVILTADDLIEAVERGDVTLDRAYKVALRLEELRSFCWSPTIGSLTDGSTVAAPIWDYIYSLPFEQLGVEPQRMRLQSMRVPKEPMEEEMRQQGEEAIFGKLQWHPTTTITTKKGKRSTKKKEVLDTSTTRMMPVEMGEHIMSYITDKEDLLNARATSCFSGGAYRGGKENWPKHGEAMAMDYVARIEGERSHSMESGVPLPSF